MYPVKMLGNLDIWKKQISDEPYEDWCAQKHMATFKKQNKINYGLERNYCKKNKMEVICKTFRSCGRNLLEEQTHGENAANLTRIQESGADFYRKAVFFVGIENCPWNGSNLHEFWWFWCRWNAEVHSFSITQKSVIWSISWSIFDSPRIQFVRKNTALLHRRRKNLSDYVPHHAANDWENAIFPYPRKNQQNALGIHDVLAHTNGCRMDRKLIVSMQKIYEQ